jgi:hypothetical protein
LYIVLIVAALLRIKSTFLFIGFNPILSSGPLVLDIVLYVKRGYTSLNSLSISSNWLLASLGGWFLTLVYRFSSSLLTRLGISISLIVDFGVSTILDMICLFISAWLGALGLLALLATLAL